MTGRRPVAPEVRFFNYTSQQGDCWIWTGGTSRGYGHFWNGRKIIKAHRWAYEYFCVQLPAGLELDHLCRVTLCVNPWHLDPVTPKVNILRSNSPSAMSARRDVCIYGHPLESTPLQRICRICRREASRRYKAAHRGVSA
jgi:hypothetical protein